jgi:hypothetical protein
VALSSSSSALTRSRRTVSFARPRIRIDIITVIDGVEFPDAWAERVPARFADQDAAVLSRKHLLINKRTSGRDQDLLDVKWLEKTGKDR